MDGLVVLDISDNFAGAYCTGLMAGLGADVIKVEPPEGDPLRRSRPFFAAVPAPESSGLFHYLNAGKKSVTIDQETTMGARRFRQLGKLADVVVESFRPGVRERLGLGYEELARENPRLILTSITDFGQDGPYRDFLGGELVTYALSGLMYLTGEPDREPLRLPEGLSSSIVGCNAFTGTLAAVYVARETGMGQHVDVSSVETLASCHLRTVSTYTHTGEVMKRMGNWSSDYGLIPCRDGYLGINGISTGAAWERFCGFIGRLDLLEDPRFRDEGSRNAHGDELLAILTEWAIGQEKEATFHAAQRAGLAFAYARELDEVTRDEHLRERAFFVSVDHPVAGRLTYPGGPFRSEEHPWRQGRAPLLGEHDGEVQARFSTVQAAEMRVPLGRQHQRSLQQGRLPLEGVRVLDLGIAWAGTQCTKLLADLGAETIHIESPVRPDTRGPTRPTANSGIYPENTPGSRPWNHNGLFNERHRNKLSLCLDLRSSQGQELLEELVAVSDVLVENYSRRTVEKLGLFYERFRRINPSVIMISMPGFGHSGSLASYTSWGHTLEELSGASAITGYDGGAPQVSWIFYSDPTSGIIAAGAAMAALQHLRSTGHGAHIELAQLEATIRLIGHAFLNYQASGHIPERVGNIHPWAAPAGVYRCAGNDNWLALEVLSDQEFQSLCAVIGKHTLAEDSRFADGASRYKNRDALDRVIAEWTKSRNSQEAMPLLQGAGVRAGAVLSAPELLADPHLAARGFFQTISHPEAGRYPVPGMHFKLSGTPGAIRTPAPVLGQHNRLILKEILGRDEGEVAVLERDRVVATTPADTETLPV